MLINNRYAESHQSPAGPGDGRPTAKQVIQDENLEGKLLDKVILITGCSSGIGTETARALLLTGAQLYLTARNLSKVRVALADVINDPKVHLLELDLESLASVRNCAATFLSQSKQLNIIINNAGIRHVPIGRTKDGFEKHLGVNHLSHFLLVQLLLPILLASSTPSFHSRVVAVSSTAHRMAPIFFDDLNFDNETRYTPPDGYAQSKLANIYMTNEIERRYGNQGLHGLALRPGGVRTGLQGPSSIKELFNWYAVKNIGRILKITKTTEQGAATSVWASTSKDLEGKGGLYLEDCGISQPVKEGWGILDSGYVERAFDLQGAERLWDLSCKLVKVEEN